MDVWGKLNKGLQVVQNQLDTYVDGGQRDAEESTATSAALLGGAAASPASDSTDSAGKKRIQELEEALQLAEDRNQLINTEFKELLRQKENELLELKQSSAGGETSPTEASTRDELAKKGKELQEVEAKAEAKLTRLKQQAKAKINSLQEQLSVLQQQRDSHVDDASTVQAAATDLDNSQIVEAEREVKDLRQSLQQMQLDNQHLSEQLKEVTNSASPSTDAAELDSLRSSVENLEKQLSEAAIQHQAEVKAMQESSAMLRSSVESLNQRFSEQSSEVERMEEQDTVSQAEIMNLQAQLESLNTEREDEIRVLREEVQALSVGKNTAVEAVQHELTSKEEQIHELDQRHCAAKDELSKLREELDSQSQKLLASKSLVEEQLKEVRADLEARNALLVSESADLAKQLEEEHAQFEKRLENAWTSAEEAASQSHDTQVQDAVLAQKTLNDQLAEVSERARVRECELEELHKKLALMEETVSGNYVPRETYTSLAASVAEADGRSKDLASQLEVTNDKIQEQELRLTDTAHSHGQEVSALQLQLEQLQEELSICTDQLQQDVESRDQRIQSLLAEAEVQQRYSSVAVGLSSSMSGFGSDLESSTVIDGQPSTPTGCHSRAAADAGAAAADAWSPVKAADYDSAPAADQPLSVDSLQQVLEAKEQALKELNAKAEVKFEKLKAQAKKKLGTMRHQHAAEKEELTVKWQQRVEHLEQELAVAGASDAGRESQSGGAATWEKSLEQRLQRLQELENSGAPVTEAAPATAGNVLDGGAKKPVRLADLKKKCEDLAEENADLRGKVEALSAENTELMNWLDSNRPASSQTSLPAPSGGTESEAGGLAEKERSEDASTSPRQQNLVANMSQDMEVIAEQVDNQLNAVLSSVATFLFQVKDQLSANEEMGDLNVPVGHEAMTRSVSELCQLAHSTQKKHADLEREHMALSMSLSTMQVSLHQSQTQLSTVEVGKEHLEERERQLGEALAENGCLQLESKSLLQEVNDCKHKLLQKEELLSEQAGSVSLLENKLDEKLSQLTTLQAQHDKTLHALQLKESEFQNAAADKCIAEDELAAAKESVDQLKSSVAQLKADFHIKDQAATDAEEQLRRTLEEHQSHATEVQHAQNQHTTELQHAQDQHTTELQHAQDQHTTELQHAQDQLAAVQQELEERTEELSAASASRVQLEVTVKNLQVRSDKVEEERQRQSSQERSGLVEELRLWRNKAEESQSLLSSNSSQLADLQIQWSEQNGELSQLRQRLSESETRCQRLSQEKEKVEADFTDAQSQLNAVITNLHAAHASAAQSLASGEAEQKRLQRQIQDLEDQLSKEGNQLHLAQGKLSTLANEKQQVQALYSSLHSEVAAKQTQRGQESFDNSLLQQQLADAEAARSQLQADLDSSLVNLRDRETQTLQLSSEVARLSSQQSDVERQMRQMARQRDLAQSQEDHLRSQVASLQASASLVPQLQHQIEVGTSSVRDANRRYQESDQQRSVIEQTVSRLTEQVTQLETERNRLEAQFQEEIRVAQQRQRDLAKELEQASMEKELHLAASDSSSARAGAANDDDVLTASTVLVPYPTEPEDVERLQAQLSAETARNGKLEQELHEAKRQVEDLAKQRELPREQQPSAPQASMDVSLNLGAMNEGDDGPASWSHASEGSAAPSTAAMATRVLFQCAQQLRLHSLGMTRRLVRAQPRVRMAVLVYLILIHGLFLFCLLH